MKLNYTLTKGDSVWMHTGYGGFAELVVSSVVLTAEIPGVYFHFMNGLKFVSFEQLYDYQAEIWFYNADHVVVDKIPLIVPKTVSPKLELFTLQWESMFTAEFVNSYLWHAHYHKHTSPITQRRSKIAEMWYDCWIWDVRNNFDMSMYKFWGFNKVQKITFTDTIQDCATYCMYVLVFPDYRF